MLLKNEYTKIKETNDLSLKTLRGENRATINDLGKRLEALTWNCYEIERIKKDLIDMAARCELEGRTLQQEVGGDTDAFLLELAADLPRGTPLDSVCTWYPRWMLLMAALNIPGLLLPSSTGPQLIRVVSSPFVWLIWLCILAWFQRIGLKIKIRYGRGPQTLWYILMLAIFVAFCILPNNYFPTTPGTISYGFVIVYELAWAAGCQFWQTFHYNRWAARHPWREQPREV